MKNLLTLVLLCCFAQLRGQDVLQETTTTDDGYVLVWQDEFNVDGPPNADNWNYEEGFVRNEELQWYQPQNAWCRNGVLTIAAREESRPNPNYNSKSNDWRKLRKSIFVSSASLTTRGKHEFTYGRFEVRARVSAVPGTWPAIWLVGSKYPWPCCGEIDIMSFYRHHGVPSILANVCWGGEEDNSQWDTVAFPISHFLSEDENWNQKFHIWRMDWDHYFIRTYVDDQLLNETSLTQTFNAPTSTGADDNPFESPLYFIINLAMGSSGGYFHKDVLPTYFDIDYVRVYQKW